MKHLFVPYELALLAKEKGFNEECFREFKTPIAHTRNDKGEIVDVNREPRLSDLYERTNDSRVSYKDHINAPIYFQVIDWFKEFHDIDCYYAPSFKDQYSANCSSGFIKHGFTTPQEALNAALTEAFKLIP